MLRCMRSLRVLCLAGFLTSAGLLVAVAADSSSGPATAPSPATATSPSTLPATTPASRPAVAAQPFRWRQINDAAGGECTGIYFHSGDASIRYAASGDTGGYRWDYDNQRWAC